VSRNLHLLPDPMTGEPWWVASCGDCGVELAVGHLDEQDRTERRGGRRCPECGSAVAWRLPGVTRLHRDLVAAGVVQAEGGRPGQYRGGRWPC
jgi:DNA-directed RNA polymerase subunit RPC12/RpoP